MAKKEKEETRKQDGIKVVREFEDLSKKIHKIAKKKGLVAISNRRKLFIDGHPNRRWWFAETEDYMLVSEEYGLCDHEAMEFLHLGEQN